MVDALCMSASVKEKMLSSTEEHRRQLAFGGTGMYSAFKYTSSKVAEMLSMPEECALLMMDRVLNIPLNFTLPKCSLPLRSTMMSRQKGDDPRGKRSFSSHIMRELPLHRPHKLQVTVVPNDGNWTFTSASDFIRDLATPRVHTGSNLTVTGTVYGVEKEAMEFSDRCYLDTIAAEGMDVRHMALKAVLLLHQTILMVGCRTGRWQASNQNVPIVGSATQSAVLDAAKTNKVLLDVTSFNELQIKVLGVLCAEWPSRVGTYPEGQDIYSLLRMEKEYAYLYSTSDEVLNVKLDGQYGNPDALWSTIIWLFDNMGYLGQLYEVLRDSRGLCPLVLRCATETESPRDRYVQCDYPLSRIANRFIVGRVKQAVLASVPELHSSTAMLVLDGLMGLESVNLMHAEAELLGLFNMRLYPDDPNTSAKYHSMLIDYNYQFDGPKGGLVKRFAPWLKCLVGSGKLFRCGWDAYVRGIRKSVLDYTQPTSDVVMPLARYLTTDRPLCSPELVLAPIEINPATVGTIYSEAHMWYAVNRALTWLAAVGVNGSVPVWGMSLAGGSERLATTQAMVDTVTELCGTYSLERISIVVPDCTPQRGYRDLYMDTLLTRLEILSPGSAESSPFVGAPVVRSSIGSMGPGSRLKTVHSRTMLPVDGQVRIPLKPPSSSKETESPTPTDTQSDDIVVPDPIKTDEQWADSPDPNTVSIHVSKVQTRGDGNCGLHALRLGMVAHGILDDNETMMAKVGVEPGPASQWWTDDALGAIAKVYGFGLSVYEEREAVMHVYNPELEKRLLIISEPGHYVATKEGDDTVLSIRDEEKATIDNPEEVIRKAVDFNKRLLEHKIDLGNPNAYSLLAAAEARTQPQSPESKRAASIYIAPHHKKACGRGVPRSK